MIGVISLVRLLCHRDNALSSGPKRTEFFPERLADYFLTYKTRIFQNNYLPGHEINFFGKEPSGS